MAWVVEKFCGGVLAGWAYHLREAVIHPISYLKRHRSEIQPTSYLKTIVLKFIQIGTKRSAVNIHAQITRVLLKKTTCQIA
jgi:hypothetical protein